eukprot:2152753-Rhodomonas_salina.1
MAHVNQKSAWCTQRVSTNLCKSECSGRNAPAGAVKFAVGVLRVEYLLGFLIVQARVQSPRM